MSLHPSRAPTRERSARGVEQSRFRSRLKTALLALARASARRLHRRRVRRIRTARGSAFHVNWLFFTALSCGRRACSSPCSASRRRAGRAPVIRFIEGYVAFLPVAFVFLLLIALRRAAATSSRGRTRRIRIPEKAIYFNPAFLIVARHRDLRR